MSKTRKAVDAVVVWEKTKDLRRQKAFFFKGDTYRRFDIERDRFDGGYPRPIAGNWRKLDVSSVDAALKWPTKGWLDRTKVYFFSGRQYYRFDIENDEVDPEYPKPIAGNWKGLWPDGVDAGLVWDDETAYFFKGDQYVRFGIKENRVVSEPAKISDDWPELWAEGLDAAVVWPKTQTVPKNRAYFFRAYHYKRLNMVAKKGGRTDGDYPKEFGPANWRPPSDLAVYANIADTPGHVCHDARLFGGEPPSTSYTYPYGPPEGQAGWDMGVNYSNLADLLQKLRTTPTPEHCSQELIQPHEITRLGLHAHGQPGKVYINGQNSPSILDVSSMQTEPMKSQLMALHELTIKDAYILLIGCMAGQTEAGREFMKRISAFWRDRYVVAFWTLGYVHGAKQKRKGDSCTEPGMRDGPHAWGIARGTRAAEEREIDYERKWQSVLVLPWASERSPHAVVACNGTILRDEQRINAP
jgi:hypothetical protein